MKKYIVLLCAALPLSGLAALKPSVLAGGINMTQLAQCRTLLKKCPMTGPVRDIKCVQQITTNEQSCVQLTQISKWTDVSADSILVSPLSTISLLALQYPADGQVDYAVVTSDGKIITMNVDPRKIDLALTKKYKDTPVFSRTDGKPSYAKLSSGLQTLTMTVKMTEKCVACREIGKVNIVYTFSADGKYIGAQVREMSH